MSPLRTLVLGLCLALAAPWAAAREAAARPAADAAEVAYQKARQAYYRFKEDLRLHKFRHHWLRVTGLFEAVARDHPGTPRAADALFTAGRMYLDLHAISRLPADQENALGLFVKLVEGYPKSNLADDGQMYVSLHWLEVKKDRARAVASLTYLLEQFPGGDVTPRARRMLEDLGGPPADDPEPAGARSGPRPEPEARPAGKPEARPVAPVSEGEAPVLADIQVDTSPDYTRITLHTGAACTYKWGLLPPDAEHAFPRLYVDLKGTTLDPQLKGPIELADSVVRRIRVAPFQRDVARVVVDLRSLGDHKVFPMDSPARVVLDVSGSTDRTARELGTKRREAASAKSEEPARPGGAAEDGGAPGAATEKPGPLEKVIADAVAERPAGEAPGGEKPDKPRTEKPKPPVPKSLSKPGQSLSLLAGLKVRKVVLDPGHGGRDPGAIGKAGTLEKDITLDLAQRLAKLLRADKELGLKQVLLTRTGDDFLALEKRTAIANKVGADLFISLHCNAHRSRKFRGVETFYLDLTDDRYSMRLAARENSTSEKTISDLKFILADLALKSHVDDSIALGESIQRATVGTLRRSYKNVVDLKLKPALFYVLIGARMPSVLVETSFLSNQDEEKRLKTPEYRDKIVRGIHQGIRNFIQARDAALEPG